MSFPWVINKFTLYKFSGRALIKHEYPCMHAITKPLKYIDFI